MTAAQAVSSRERLPEFDRETFNLIQTLHSVLHSSETSNSSSVRLDEIRDHILSSCNEVKTRVLLLSAVARAAFKESLHKDAAWTAFFKFSDKVEQDDINDGETVGFENALAATQRRRGRSTRLNETKRLRNLAVVAALWSPDVVRFYRFNEAAQTHMQQLRMSAVAYPNFVEDFLPRWNAVRLARHCRALLHGKCKDLREAPVQIKDLCPDALKQVSVSQAAQQLWLDSRDGVVPVDQEATLLCTLRPAHYQLFLLQRDLYGLMIVRDGTNPNQVPVEGGGSTSQHHSHARRDSHHHVEQEQSKQDRTLRPRAQLCLSAREQASRAKALELREAMQDQDGEEMAADSHDTDGADSSDDESTTSQTSETIPSLDGRQSSLCTSPSPAAMDANIFAAEADLCIDTAMTDVCSHLDQNRSTMDREVPLEDLTCIPQLDPVYDQLPIPTLDYVLPISAPLVNNAGGRLSIEEDLHNRYHDVVQSSLAQPTTARQNNIECAESLITQWLHSGTQWASVWSTDVERLGFGMTYHATSADIFFCSSAQIGRDLDAGLILDKPVVVKVDFADSGRHTIEDVATALCKRSTGGMTSARATAAGSWTRVLDDYQLFLFSLQGPAADLGAAVKYQMPQEEAIAYRNTPKLIVLEKHDILFVPPGCMLSSVFYHPQPCLTEGGLLWQA